MNAGLRAARLPLPQAACAVVFALWIAGGSAAAQPTRRDASRAPGDIGQCGTCHPAERVAFGRSRHATENVRCTSCHGGDDRSLNAAVAHGAGFKGRPRRASIPALCASCHADIERMRPFNLPVDQLALYQTSGHGVRLARGDTRVAVCSDCHGAHEILARDDPASHVFPTNIAKTCGTCHGDSTRIRGASGKTYGLYMGSVHARELHDRGNLRAPTCVSCHGVHGAAPPAVGDVDKVCGHCHTAERRYFSSGAHRTAMQVSELTECASCHGEHAVEATRPERLAGLCAECHGTTSPQAVIGDSLWAEYRAAEQAIAQATAMVDEAEAVPLQTEDFRARVEEARTYLSEAMPAAHALDPEVFAGFTTRARSVGVEVESEVRSKLINLRTQKLLLILFWFYVILTLIVLGRFRRVGGRG